MSRKLVALQYPELVYSLSETCFDHFELEDLSHQRIFGHGQETKELTDKSECYSPSTPYHEAPAAV